MNKEEACRIYASVWNCLLPDDLINTLDENVQYSSQTVSSDMNGKDQITDCFRKIMNAKQFSPENRVFAQLAETEKELLSLMPSILDKAFKGEL